MGGRHSKYRSPRRVPPIPSISIPNYKYPKLIFSYLMSQSGGYNITFTTPNGESGNVSMPSNNPQPVNTSPISSTAAPVPTSAPRATTRPAYSTGLTTPPAGSNSSSGSSGSTDTKVLSPSPYVPPGIPPFWVAAIWAMAMTDEIGKIKDYNTLKLFYKTVADKIKEIMGDRSDGVKNVSALIYFCTVVTILFEPFLGNFTYNYLNVHFPYIFNDLNTGSDTISGASKYSKFIMVNYYSTHALDIIKSNRYPGSGYIPITEQKVMRYAVPNIMNSILDVLTDKDPIAGV